MKEGTSASEIRSLLQKFAWGSQIYGIVAATRNSRIARDQRQRLSLARAVARKPSILLLDEAASHLDVATEARIEENLRQLSCTRITIAHRLSTVRVADRILVLEGGSIV